MNEVACISRRLGYLVILSHKQSGTFWCLKLQLLSWRYDVITAEDALNDGHESAVRRHLPVHRRNYSGSGQPLGHSCHQKITIQ